MTFDDVSSQSNGSTDQRKGTPVASNTETRRIPLNVQLNVSQSVRHREYCLMLFSSLHSLHASSLLDSGWFLETCSHFFYLPSLPCLSWMMKKKMRWNLCQILDHTALKALPEVVKNIKTLPGWFFSRISLTFLQSWDFGVCLDPEKVISPPLTSSWNRLGNFSWLLLLLMLLFRVKDTRDCSLCYMNVYIDLEEVELTSDHPLQSLERVKKILKEKFCQWTISWHPSSSLFYLRQA